MNSAQIGWGINSKLINDAIKQVGQATKVGSASVQPPTTTTTTTHP